MEAVSLICRDCEVRLRGRGAVIGRGENEGRYGGEFSPGVDRPGHLSLKVDGGCRAAGLGLLMMGDADGAVGMFRAVIMMMECGDQGGE